MVSVIEVTPLFGLEIIFTENRTHTSESIEEDHTQGLLDQPTGAAHTETDRQPLHKNFSLQLYFTDFDWFIERCSLSIHCARGRN